MKKEELEAIAVTERAASPGPWTALARGIDGGFCGRGPTVRTSEQASDDARFIAHARAAVPSLLAYVEEQEQEQDRNFYKASAESKETLYETACAGRESARGRVADLDSRAKGLERDIAKLNGEGVAYAIRVGSIGRERDAAQKRAHDLEGERDFMARELEELRKRHLGNGCGK